MLDMAGMVQTLGRNGPTKLASASVGAGLQTFCQLLRLSLRLAWWTSRQWLSWAKFPGFPPPPSPMVGTEGCGALRTRHPPGQQCGQRPKSSQQPGHLSSSICVWNSQSILYSQILRSLFLHYIIIHHIFSLNIRKICHNFIHFHRSDPKLAQPGTAIDRPPVASRCVPTFQGSPRCVPGPGRR